MTEPIFVEAPSEAAAQQLAGSLGARFPLEVSRVDDAWVVVVTPGRSSERYVSEVLDEVKRWLVDAGRGSDARPPRRPHLRDGALQSRGGLARRADDAERRLRDPQLDRVQTRTSAGLSWAARS